MTTLFLYENIFIKVMTAGLECVWMQTERHSCSPSFVHVTYAYSNGVGVNMTESALPFALFLMRFTFFVQCYNLHLLLISVGRDRIQIRVCV